MRRRRPQPPSPPQPSAPLGPASWTPVGTVGSAFLGRVDAAGLVAPAAAPWHLEWWIGAEDRWHLAGDERAVRQGLLDSSPVVETWMRVPSGDAVQRVWAVPGEGGPVVVVEVENASPVPVALALAVVPGTVGAGGDGGPQRIELDGAVLRVDGRPAVLLDRGPSRAASTDAGAAPLRALVTDGEAGEAMAPVSSPAGTAAAAVVVPLPHTARVRVVLPLGEAAGPGAEVPDATAVAHGWASQAAVGARVEVPDDRLDEALTAVRRQVLLWAQASGDAPFVVATRLAVALARLGMGEEAVAVLAQVTRRSEAARRLSRRSRHPEARAAWVDAVERVRDVVGDDVLAERLGGAPRGTARTGARAPSGTVADALALLSTASPTWGWGRDGEPDVAAAAGFVELALDALVVESDDGLDLLPQVPDSWLGQPVDVHDLPTGCGLLSFAVRWHGERPALLWDLQPRPGTDGPVRLRVPGLDPAWSTDEPKGDALLAAPAAATTGGAAG